MEKKILGISIIILACLGILFVSHNSIQNEKMVSFSSAEWSNKLAITKTYINSENNFLIKIANISETEIVIDSLFIGENKKCFSETILPNQEKIFIIENEKNCIKDIELQKLTIEFTENGEIKTETYPVEIYFECRNQTIKLLTNKCEVCETSYDGNATTDSVLSGYTFYSNSSSLLTGTIQTKDLNADTPSFETGYYSTGDLNLTDSDLTAENIAEGTTIFGIDGNAALSGNFALHTGQTTSYGSAPDDTNYDGTDKSECFVNNEDGTVSDICTGLMWKNNHQSAASSVSFCEWPYAVNSCLGDTTAGYDDWRLGSVLELYSVIDYHCVTGEEEGCIGVFTNNAFEGSIIGSGLTWTSTTTANHGGYVYVVWPATSAMQKAYKTGHCSSYLWSYAVCVRTEG
jgi:hypothetical protein